MSSFCFRNISFCLLSMLLLLTACNSYKHPNFSKKDVRKAQKVIGVNFSKNAIDTMYRYLGRNQAGYDSSRVYSIDKEVFPALLFDPHPDGFIISKAQIPINWGKIEQIALPTDKETLAFYSIRQLAGLIQSRQITSEELTKLYIDRIKKI